MLLTVGPGSPFGPIGPGSPRGPCQTALEFENTQVHPEKVLIKLNSYGPTGLTLLDTLTLFLSETQL